LNRCCESQAYESGRYFQCGSYFLAVFKNRETKVKLKWILTRQKRIFCLLEVAGEQISWKRRWETRRSSWSRRKSENIFNLKNQQIKFEKFTICRRLEEEISEYDGKDPLDPWYKYVCWIEQSYVKSGNDGGLQQVLEKCIVKFESENRYKQDRRLIKLFIKYVRAPQFSFAAVSINHISSRLTD
jgi:hypothetical protein